MSLDIGNLCKEVVDKWGVDKQILMMLEEMSELQKELLKYLRLKDTKKYNDDEFKNKLSNLYDRIWEEMADVSIMLNQMYYIFGFPREQIVQKIERLEDRLAGIKHD